MNIAKNEQNQAKNFDIYQSEMRAVSINELSMENREIKAAHLYEIGNLAMIKENNCMITENNCSIGRTSTITIKLIKFLWPMKSDAIDELEFKLQKIEVDITKMKNFLKEHEADLLKKKDPDAYLSNIEFKTVKYRKKNSNGKDSEFETFVITGKDIAETKTLLKLFTYYMNYIENYIQVPNYANGFKIFSQRNIEKLKDIEEVLQLPVSKQLSDEFEFINEEIQDWQNTKAEFIREEQIKKLKIKRLKNYVKNVFLFGLLIIPVIVYFLIKF